jgi:hypothetical protein
MTNTQAILAGAAMIAAAAFLASGGTPRAATGEGRWVLAVAGSQPIAFVTDTGTGETMICRASGCRRLEIAEATPADVEVPEAPALEPMPLDQILQSPPPDDLPAPPPPRRKPSKSPESSNILDLMRGKF